MDHLVKSYSRSMRWAVRHWGGDGTPPSTTPVVESAYKAVWALTLCGETVTANRAANWYLGRLDEAGDLPAPRKEEAFLDGHYLYANGYASIGALVLGRFDLARPMLQFIRGRQHLDTGGFLSFGPAVTPEFERTDTVSTSISLLALTFGGYLDEAKQAARYLQAMLEKQPDAGTRFLSTAGLDGSLLPHGRSQETHAVIDIRDPEQDWYFIGLPAMVLPYLYRATGESKWLDLASAYLDYLDGPCDKGAFGDCSSGKSGVAAAHLFELTGQKRYREIALEVADLILSFQTPWGFFAESYQEQEGPPVEITWSDLDMTLEYSLWLNMIERHLSN